MGRNRAGRPGSGRGVRIIAGKWRGRRLPVADSPGLRPTGDRVREMLFNWLQAAVHGRRVLDLFAGSGALGLEAASRGAAEVLLLEKQPRLAAHLRALVAALPDAGGVHVRQADALRWLTEPCQQGFDLVFVDPPFAANLWLPVLDGLQSSGCLRAGGLVYLESPLREAPAIPPGWRVLKEKGSGEVLSRLLAAGVE